MAWIEVHLSLPDHPKTMEAAMLLDVSQAQIVGHLVCLWTWAVEAKPDGRLDLSKPRILARAAQWDGEPGRFVDALVAVGFVDPCGAIHDWDDYAGRLMERRDRTQAQTRQRVAAYRERQRASLLKEGNAESNALRNAPVTLGNAPTGPNRTGPITSPPHGGEGAGADAPAAGPPPAETPEPEQRPLPIRAVPKPVKAKPSAHPAVSGYRRLAGGNPKEAARAAIAAAVPAEDADALERWQRAVAAWVQRGHNAANVDGMLDWYREGIPPRSRPAPPRTTPPPSANAGSPNGPYVQPQSQQRGPAPPEHLGALLRELQDRGGLQRAPARPPPKSP